MNKKEIINLLNSDGKTLFKEADAIRKKFKGDEIHLRGLIEFSNICKRNCAYCGLQAQNKKIKRYRMNEDEIFKAAEAGAKAGYKTIVLQSGEDDFFNVDKMCEIIKKIKSLNVALTLSIGEKTFKEYKAYKAAGCDRFLLRIETTDKNLYEKLHPKASFENRLKCLYNLKELGFETGTGTLVGLPEQSIASLADDILFYKELNADMTGIGPFIPHPDTILAGKTNKKNLELSIKMLAVTRLLLPDINIPATTAMETIAPQGRVLALQAGANVVMPNLTPEIGKNYQIYPNKCRENDKKALEESFKAIGRSISTDFGFRNQS